MTINCNGKLIDLSTPKIMGILNLTPDSFYDGGKYLTKETLLVHVEKMLSDGATFIDIGGYSSRPNAKHISEKEELNRVLPIVKLLKEKFPKIILSIDTFRSEIAKQVINEGASIINDISGGDMDKKMFETIANLNIPYIMMHIQGTPQNMQQNPNYKNIITEINESFAKKIHQLQLLGVNDIILDAGFGFGKTIEHNFELLQKHELINFSNLPTLIGISRKSMIYNTLTTTAKNSLNGTTVLNTLALIKNARILRVHDVKEAMECITLYSKTETPTI